MRIVFMGTPDFSIPSLGILLENNYDIQAVVTVPDKPKGRGQQVTLAPLKQFAIENNLNLLQPESLKDENFINTLKSLNSDLFVVVAFRILPREVYTIPRLGSFNLHASILPKYRGAAPINWAIINGEKETGVTTFFLEDRVDTGNMILQARVPIGENETAGELHDILADIGAEIVLHTVKLIEIGKALPLPQNNLEASSAPKIFKENCAIDWNKSNKDVHNFIRGLSPGPCAYTKFKNKVIKIYKSQLTQEASLSYAGTIVESGRRLLIATGDGLLEILELQQEGKKRMSAEEFLRGFPMPKGEKFG